MLSLYLISKHPFKDHTYPRFAFFSEIDITQIKERGIKENEWKFVNLG